MSANVDSLPTKPCYHPCVIASSPQGPLRKVCRCLVVALALVGGCRASDPRPNVVLVLIDTLRADHLSSYGYERTTSPFIDEIASKGVRFERVVSPAPTTFPSVSSLLTGESPLAFFNPRGRDDGIPAEFTTLAEILRQDGYRTAAVSGNPLVRRHEAPERGFSQGFERFDETCSSPEEATWHNTPCVTDRALKSLDELDGRPFFLYVHYLDPHHPYVPPDDRDPFIEDYDGLWYVKQGFAGPILWWLYDGEENPNASAKDIQRLRDKYDAEILAVDAGVRRLMRGVAQRGFAEDTLFVFTSDHGEAFMDHGHMGHGHSLYEMEIRVPLVFYWPHRWPEGEVRTDTVCTTSVMPSILAVAGVAAPEKAAGRSLFDGAGGAADTTPGSTCFSVAGSLGADVRPQVFSVHTGGLKLILDRRKEPPAVEIYDLAADPDEARNLNENGRAADKGGDLQALRASLEHELSRARSDAPEGKERAIDPAVEKALRSLGYIR